MGAFLMTRVFFFSNSSCWYFSSDCKFSNSVSFASSSNSSCVNFSPWSFLKWKGFFFNNSRVYVRKSYALPVVFSLSTCFSVSQSLDSFSRLHDCCLSHCFLLPGLQGKNFVFPDILSCFRDLWCSSSWYRSLLLSSFCYSFSHFIYILITFYLFVVFAWFLEYKKYIN